MRRHPACFRHRLAACLRVLLTLPSFPWKVQGGELLVLVCQAELLCSRGHGTQISPSPPEPRDPACEALAAWSTDASVVRWRVWGPFSERHSTMFYSQKPHFGDAQGIGSAPCLAPEPPGAPDLPFCRRVELTPGLVNGPGIPFQSG